MANVSSTQPRWTDGNPMDLRFKTSIAATVLWTGGLLASQTGFLEAGEEASGIDLSGYTLTFDEEFDTLDVSPRGPGTRWIAHTPWNGDFGDAKFADPGHDFPFTVKDGVLRIEARKMEGGGWRSGLLASADPNNQGFLQAYGYFEMKAKFPAGPGVWPAFWLISRDKDNTAEIDVVEHHGDLPGYFTSAIHVWDRHEAAKNVSSHQRTEVPVGSLSDDFHTYGVSVQEDFIRFYFDRREVWRIPTPPEHRRPKYVLVDLALGSGFPIENTPNPSFMYVDYVKAWERKP